jgi:hypothetical protein
MCQRSRCDPEKELIITDLNVVESEMAAYPGPFSFGHVITQLAGKEDSGALALDWLRQWEKDQEVNGQTVPARPSIQEKVIEPWQRNDGYDPASGLAWRPNFENAPFRLFAIVNRLDLASNFRFERERVTEQRGPRLVAMGNSRGRYGGGGGVQSGQVVIGQTENARRPAAQSVDGASRAEVRLVYGVVDEKGAPLEPDFTVIFEYGLPFPEGGSGSFLIVYASQWHQLGAYEEFDSNYRNSLAALTRQCTDRQRILHGAPPLKHVRTNDGALAKGREFREFVFTDGWLQPNTVENTPPAEFFVRGSEENEFFAKAITAAGQTLLTAGFAIPPKIGVPSPNGRNFSPTIFPALSGSAVIYDNDSSVCWSSPGLKDSKIRHLISRNTCIGCHAGETATTDCVHIRSRRAGEASQLSDFLTDMSFTKIKDPVDFKIEREITELPERILLFEALVKKHTNRSLTQAMERLREKSASESK